MNLRKGIHAFTLVELLVSMTLLALLGLMLIQIVRDIMRAWNVKESQIEVRRNARTILSLLQDDLNAIYTINDSRNEIKLFLDYDPYGKQRLRFVSRLKEEQSDPVLRDAGNVPVMDGGKGYYHFSKAKTSPLRAPGGLSEVVYLVFPDAGSYELWRGTQIPVGGDMTFFKDQNIDEEKEVKSTCHLVSKDVLYFGIRCWTQQSSHWNLGKDGSLPLWDSSRRHLRSFPYYKGGTHNPAEDIFPGKVQVMLILKGQHTPKALLAEEIGENNQTVGFRFPQNFPVIPEVHQKMVRIDDEWMFYTECTEDRLTGVERGVLGTKRSPHVSESYIYWGAVVTETIVLPSVASSPLYNR